MWVCEVPNHMLLCLVKVCLVQMWEQADQYTSATRMTTTKRPAKAKASQTKH